MNQIDNTFIFKLEMKNHLDFEISQRGWLPLFEKLGYPTHVLDFTRGLIEIVKQQIRDTSETNTTCVTYTEKDFKSNIPFIENYSIKIDMSIKQGESDSNGGFSDKKSFIYIKGDNLLLYPVITISAHGKTKFDLKREVFSTIGHEMTHGYAEYMTLKSRFDIIRELVEHAGGKASVGTLMMATKDRTSERYRNSIRFITTPFSSFDQSFGDIAYISSEPEKRAQMSELRHELELKSDAIVDSQSATEAIVSSNVYRKTYKVLNDQIDIFIDLFLDEGNKHMTGTFIRSFNRVFGKKYDNLEKIIRFLNNIREDYNRFFMNRSGKIVQDIIDNNGVMDGYVDRGSIMGFSEALSEIKELER